MTMNVSRISGVGHYLPEREVSNQELEKKLDVSSDWIVKLTGVQTRRWVRKGETLNQMAVGASKKALDQAGISANEIDMIIYSTLGSDHQFPGSGCYLQKELDIPGIPALDIRNVCSGFIYGLSIADQYIKTGMCRHVLLVGAELQSTSLDLTPRGRNVSVLFGDGAGAAVISQSNEKERRILNTQIYSDGHYADKLWADAPSPNDHPRLTKALLDTDRIYPYMDGRAVFKHAVHRFPEVIEEAVRKAGMEISNLDLIIPHQANLRITEMIVRKLGIDSDKVYSNIEHYGNTTSASIPVALSEAVQKGVIADHALICLAAFGAGFSWGSALIRW